MNSLTVKPAPPDQMQREQALDPTRSILVQAPAGSGKTDLLTRRFLCLLAEVDDPVQVVAITFTNAAAAEMRNRILSELENAAVSQELPIATDDFSMPALARRALDHSRALGWKLLDLPAQLRISTIDSFCRDLALQQPLLSGLGGGLGIFDQPKELYRRAARQTLERFDSGDPALQQAIAALLDWRDNNWQNTEDLLVEMLGQRDRWMHGFVLEREQDWEALRERLERPFANAVRDALIDLSRLLDEVPDAREVAMELARFACTQSDGQLHKDLAELAEFPSVPLSPCGADAAEAIEEARVAHAAFAGLMLTGAGTFRKQVNIRLGFPADCKREKARLLELIDALSAVPGLRSALWAVCGLPPLRYTEEDWQIVRACFTLLRHAAGQLRVVFAEAGAVDFIEVAQIAQRVLTGADGQPTDAALAVSDGVRHLLVDEFQDTSRRQHQLLSSLIAAWPQREGRTCFAVGDPMQSIYFFRDADAELFPRVRDNGLEIASDEPLLFHSVTLSANFRTTPPLIDRLNQIFTQVFAADDGSGVTFSPAEPPPEPQTSAGPPFSLHLSFEPPIARGKSADSDDASQREAIREAQIQEIVELIGSHRPAMEKARAAGKKYRIAVLARARKSLMPIAQALHQAAIPFRAVELEKLAARPEVFDALALARALLNPMDRVAWLGVLRAPWCGLSLDDLHTLTSADDPALLARSVPDLLAERLPLLMIEGRGAAERVLNATLAAASLRASQPPASPGTWLEQIWLRLGGADCVDTAARANLDLLWSCLDRLPAGEQDLLSPALDGALDRLTALPDPDVNSDYGVQLMTIHKSKGLEFEVVIVPDLQAGIVRGSRKLLSWLERGLANPDESGEITEFLIAPLQPKGADRGRSKAWVDQVYHQRETQEDRRILYVAATRVRRELHLFARPACKFEADGSLSLAEPSASLLATAWPALAAEVRARFEAWKTTDKREQTAESDKSAATNEYEIESIAASAETNLLVMPTPIKPTLLLRLPADYQPSASLSSHPGRGAADLPRIDSSSPTAVRLELREEGGFHSRALGTAVHALLEELARLRATSDWQPARAALQRFSPRIAAQIRASGIEPTQAANIAAQALNLAFNASHDPVAQWILSPHAEAVSEAGWAGVVDGTVRTVRMDRVFRAGLTPQSEGQNAEGHSAWWIVDYKTAHAENLDPAEALPKLRPLFAPQLEAYAALLRNLHGPDAPIRASLYYPRMLLLDWWEI